jgi:hypothetical protein
MIKGLDYHLIILDDCVDSSEDELSDADLYRKERAAATAKRKAAKARKLKARKRQRESGFF